MILDVTHAEDIARLTARIDASGEPLRAVVNNAGLAADAPVETLALEDGRAVFDVNVFGAVALTQALLPVLHRSSGRVVNISSIGGKVAMPAFGACSGSKFALEAITDVLNLLFPNVPIAAGARPPRGAGRDRGAWRHAHRDGLARHRGGEGAA